MAYDCYIKVPNRRKPDNAMAKGKRTTRTQLDRRWTLVHSKSKQFL